MGVEFVYGSMSQDRGVYTEREVVSISEIAEGTGLSPEAVREAVLGEAYYMEDKEKIESFLGMDMTQWKLYVGRAD